MKRPSSAKLSCRLLSMTLIRFISQVLAVLLAFPCSSLSPGSFMSPRLSKMLVFSCLLLCQRLHLPRRFLSSRNNVFPRWPHVSQALSFRLRFEIRCWYLFTQREMLSMGMDTNPPVFTVSSPPKPPCVQPLPLILHLDALLWCGLWKRLCRSQIFLSPPARLSRNA